MMIVDRHLPPDLFVKVISGKGEVPDAARVPGAAAGHEGRDHPKQ